MATMNKFPPDVPKTWDEAQNDVENASDGLRAKAANVAEKATDSIKDSYYRAKDALTDMDPSTTARETGDAVLRTIERNPVAAFGLGALSLGLIAWASIRGQQPSYRDYQPDYGRLRNLFTDYRDEAAKTGKSVYKDGESWLNSSRGYSRDYAQDAVELAREGSRYIARRSEKEPLAAILGVGIAVYVLGSLLTSATSDRSDRR